MEMQHVWLSQSLRHTVSKMHTTHIMAMSLEGKEKVLTRIIRMSWI